MRIQLLFCTLLLVGACAKDSNNTSAPNGNYAASGGSSSGKYASLSALARYSGTNYSQSVSVSDANAMIGSYLASVHYPAQDTALRSLTFDADTLRSYLADTSIKTLKFMLAHRPGWAMNTNTWGQWAGNKPIAMTLVIVGLSQNDQYILNNRGQVFEHCYPCPQDCPNSGASALIQ